MRLDLELKSRREEQQTQEKNIAARHIYLPSNAIQVVMKALERGQDEVVVSKFNIDFCVRDLLTLRSPRWLNDEAINFYMQAISERSTQRHGTLPSLHAFSSFFFPKLRDRGYDAVKASTKKISPSVLTRDLILFPIHLGMHWCLTVIDFRLKTISYYDSLHGSNLRCIATIRAWLASESRDKLSREFDFEEWVESCPKNIPAQQNGYDCGVFSLVYAEKLSRRAPFNFSQKDMTYWRDRISFEIITGKLLE